MAGWGELLWMVDGRVVHVEPIRDFASVGELVQKTATLFAGKG